MNKNYRDGNIHCMDTPGKRVRALRQSKSLSQVTVAGLAGIDQSTLSDIENDKGFSAENLMRLSEVLESDAQYIMRGTNTAGDVLRKIKALVSIPHNENFSLPGVSDEGKPPATTKPKPRTLKLVNANRAPQLNPAVRKKLVSKEGKSNERHPSKAKEKPRNGKAP